jgi:hypothetical protein
LPLTPLHGVHYCHPWTRAEVDRDVEEAGANGTVKDDYVGDKDDAGKFVAVELDSEVDGTMKRTMFPGRRAMDRAAVYLQ